MCISLCEEQFFVTERFQLNLVLKGAAESACWDLDNTLKTFGLENRKKCCLLLMLLTVLHVNNFRAPAASLNLASLEHGSHTLCFVTSSNAYQCKFLT